jgi:nucleoid-associated protein YgaU
VTPKKKALVGVQAAAEKLVERAKQDLAAKPTSANLRNLLRSAARAAVVGNEDAAATAIADVAPWAEKQRDLAEARFRKSPTSENFKILYHADANCIRLGGRPMPARPAGLQRVKAGDSHKLAPGESLSLVSKTYYGSFSYWDVIARANVDLIKNFDFPPAGVILKIP